MNDPMFTEPMVEIAPGRWVRAGIPIQVFDSEMDGGRLFRCRCGSDVFRARRDTGVECNICGAKYRATS